MKTAVFKVLSYLLDSIYPVAAIGLLVWSYATHNIVFWIISVFACLPIFIIVIVVVYESTAFAVEWIHDRAGRSRY